MPTNKASNTKVETGNNSAETKKPTVSRLAGSPILLLLLVTLGMGFLGGWLGSKNHYQTMATKPGNVNQQIILNESQLISEIAKNVGPSVVSVNVTSQSVQRDVFFGFSQPVEQQSAGTGVIISSDGYIVTNRHVVPAGATDISVTLSDGTELTDIQLVGRTGANDPLDVAFLKIKDKKGKNLQPAKIADSSKVQVGDRVVAIGNALGQFQNTVTSGIISGFGRNIEAGDENGSETLQNLFQTDAAVNQGNSGGPLVNINGEVIGINTAVASGRAENISFAIPINDLQGLIKSVLEKGRLERPYLGIRYVLLTDDYAYQYNLGVKRGAYIAPSRMGPSVLPGSPAEKAGLKEKDIIIKVDNTEINEKNSLTSLISRKTVGDTVVLTIIRGGKETTLKVVLEAAPTS